MKFLITIYQDEDEMFIAECPSIPGCGSQGKTEHEAENNIRKAIKECLEVRSEKGMPLTEKKGTGYFFPKKLPVPFFMSPFSPKESSMIDGVKTKKLKVIPDERGRLMEILRSDKQRLDPHDNDIPYDWRRKDG